MVCGITIDRLRLRDVQQIVAERDRARRMIAKSTWFLLLVLSVGQLTASWAGHISYSLAGTIHKRAEFAQDPWGIGTLGKPFRASLLVNDVTDDQAAEVHHASFVLSGGSIQIGNDLLILSASVVNEPRSTITFTEHSTLGTFVGASLHINYNGHRDELTFHRESPIRLFDFDEEFEVPPIVAPVVFPRILNVFIGRGNYYVGGEELMLSSQQVPELLSNTSMFGTLTMFFALRRKSQ